MTNLDMALVDKVKKRKGYNKLTDAQCVAINLFWRKDIPVALIARAFGVGKNTMYYRAITGDADSYPTSEKFNSAKRTNELIDRIGEAAATRKYVTSEMNARINAAMADVVRRCK